MFKESSDKIAEFYTGGCMLCGNKCGTDRTKKKGVCGADDKLFIASSTIHFGEEPPISGTEGSGTIFFTGCSLKCVYCQNFPISRLGQGNLSSIEDLTKKMLKLQKDGANNINFVTPTHYLPHISKALMSARTAGLTLPVVYNTSSYENPDIVEFLDDIVEIYLPDIRYSNDDDAYKYSGVRNYKEIVFKNILKFHSQKGNLQIDSSGHGVKGVLIRVLALPGKNKETMEILSFISESLSCHSYVSLMSQFHPYNCKEFPELDRKVSLQEYEELVEFADKSNMDNVYIQDVT